MPVAIIFERWVMRSTTAAATRTFAKTLSHSPKGRLIATMSEEDSFQSGDDLEEKLCCATVKV